MLEELSLNILDMGMNSLTAGATVLDIAVIENKKRDWLILRVRDNGQGMDEATLQRILATHGTTKASRKKNIGLGLALLRQTSKMCGGTFHVHSRPGRGTTVTASMRWSHVDRPPLGDLNATVLALSAVSDSVDVRLGYRSDDLTFYFSSQEGAHNESRATKKTQGQGSETRLVA